MKKIARPAKTPLVEEVDDRKSGFRVGIYFSREANDFYGDVPGFDRIRAADVKACAALVLQAIKNAHLFVWRPVIVVTHHGGDQAVTHYLGHSTETTQGASLAFDFRRCEIAPQPGNADRVVERPHEANLSDEDRQSGSPRARRRAENRDVSPFHVHGGDVIPYSEETWETLHRLRLATIATYDQLAKLFASPERLALRCASLSLLAAPVESDR